MAPARPPLCREPQEPSAVKGSGQAWRVLGSRKVRSARKLLGAFPRQILGLTLGVRFGVAQTRSSRWRNLCTTAISSGICGARGRATPRDAPCYSNRSTGIWAAGRGIGCRGRSSHSAMGQQHADAAKRRPGRTRGASGRGRLSNRPVLCPAAQARGPLARLYIANREGNRGGY
jgi:hypothetical protein